MEWVTGLQKVIDYIEDNLTGDIDYGMMSAKSFSSSYHFQRVFSILCGFTVGEYIRNRRMSLAGAELATSDVKVIDIALKYSYESPDSFAKAFYKFHGILPSNAKSHKGNLKSFSRLTLKFSLEGGTITNYRIETKPEMTLLGHKLSCAGSPANPQNAYEETKRHWLSTRKYQYILKEKRGENPIWFDIYTDFTDETFSHIIAVQSDGDVTDKAIQPITISEHLYAIFETKRCESPDELWLPLMKEIISEWLPSTDYKIAEHPQLNKLFFEKDHSKRYMEIWLPIETE